MAQPARVELRGVSFTHAGANKPALRDVSLVIEPGELCLILGPTAGGKSTFTQLLSGAIPHITTGTLTGDVIVAGLNTRDVPVDRLATVVAAVFQEPEAQIVNIFVRDELYFGPENLLRAPEEIKASAQRALELVDMVPYADSEVFELSGGQKQKVNLAAALTMQPKILVLDQPTANLDPVSARAAFQLIRRLRDELGITIIIVEHTIDDLAPLVDRVAVFDAGRLVAYDEPRRVFHHRFAGATERLGLWTPQAAEIARCLAGKVEFSTPPITEEELEPALRAELTRGNAVFVTRPQRDGATPSGAPLVDVRGLTYTYETNGVRALNDARLEIRAGEFVAIIGRNGSGKSTLAKVLTKILEAPRGTVFIAGRDITTLSLFQLTDTIGYVFQNPDHQFVTDTVYDEVAYSLRVRHVDEAEVRRRVEEILGLFHLEGSVKASPFGLSMGERRLLSVATMLVLDQRLVILDEPTIGQDQAGADALMRHLVRLHDAGKAIVIITHDMRLLAEWAERAVVMSRSRIVFDGGIAEIFSRPEIVEEAALTLPPVVSLARRLGGTPTGAGIDILTPEDFAAAWQPVPAWQAERI